MNRCSCRVGTEDRRREKHKGRDGTCKELHTEPRGKKISRKGRPEENGRTLQVQELERTEGGTYVKVDYSFQARSEFKCGALLAILERPLRKAHEFSSLHSSSRRRGRRSEHLGYISLCLW